MVCPLESRTCWILLICPVSVRLPYLGRLAAEGDAAAVAWARAAGGVLYGKTVTTEFATRKPGPTANPRNLGHTPGGSSSGSAAGVAAGFFPFAYGTQTAGSIIRPAAFCGVVGYKPSYGMISRIGMKIMSDSLDTVGVMARSVADCALLAGAVSGRDLGDPDGKADRAPRIGLCRSPTWDQALPETVALFDRVATALARAGAAVSEREMPASIAALTTAHPVVMNHESARALGLGTGRGARPDQRGPARTTGLRPGPHHCGDRRCLRRVRRCTGGVFCRDRRARCAGDALGARPGTRGPRVDRRPRVQFRLDQPTRALRHGAGGRGAGRAAARHPDHWAHWRGPRRAGLGAMGRGGDRLARASSNAAPTFASRLPSGPRRSCSEPAGEPRMRLRVRWSRRWGRCGSDAPILQSKRNAGARRAAAIPHTRRRLATRARSWHLVRGRLTHITPCPCIQTLRPLRSARR